MNVNKAPCIDELVRLVDSDHLSGADHQLIESMVESLLQYFRDRIIESQSVNQVIDINTKELLGQDGQKLADDKIAVQENLVNWTPENILAYGKQIDEFPECAKDIMMIFTRFPIGKKLSTADLYQMVLQRKLYRRKNRHSRDDFEKWPITRDLMLNHINRCGLKKMFGSEGPFILRRNRPMGDKQISKLNPLLFWIELT